MSEGHLSRARLKRKRISTAGLTIYDLLEEQPELVFSILELDALMRSELIGRDASGPIRTRSKLVKQLVAEAMGYPSPQSFARTRPRFPGQNLDVYAQRSNNLQVWNEEIDPLRRFVVVAVDAEDTITATSVVDGESLARLDATGALTSKYQASRRSGRLGSGLVGPSDTSNFVKRLHPVPTIPADHLVESSPVDLPKPGRVLTIGALYERLTPLVGLEVTNVGLDQERNRGAGLHRIVCELLGFGSYADHGQFPDVRAQALEVKLQTSPTIDLGLVSPDGIEAAPSLGSGLRHCDARYLVAFGDRSADKQSVRITNIVMATGADFFNEFQRFGGLVRNYKLQIRLPRDFFELEPKATPDESV